MTRKAVWRAIEYIVIGLIILTGAGIMYQAIATAGDREKYPPPGQLVNVSVYKLHINCVGQGEPVVVLEAGRANWSLFWSLVQPEVAKLTRVCAYDRAGLGWSDPGPEPRTSQTMVNELHTLLRRAHIQGPYVLVGHSAGGYTVRLFASQFPDEVVGMVLVDAPHEEGIFSLSSGGAERLRRRVRLARLMAPLGLVRLAGTLGLASEFEALMAKFPPEAQAISRAMSYRSQTWETAWDEMEADRESRAQVRATGSLGDIPLVVLTAAGEMSDETAKARWVQQQSELAARLSSNGRHILAEQSRHFIHLDQPDVVVEAIEQVVEAVRDR